MCLIYEGSWIYLFRKHPSNNNCSELQEYPNLRGWCRFFGPFAMPMTWNLKYIVSILLTTHLIWSVRLTLRNIFSAWSSSKLRAIHKHEKKFKFHRNIHTSSLFQLTYPLTIWEDGYLLYHQKVIHNHWLLPWTVRQKFPKKLAQNVLWICKDRYISTKKRTMIYAYVMYWAVFEKKTVYFI